MNDPRSGLFRDIAHKAQGMTGVEGSPGAGDGVPPGVPPGGRDGRGRPSGPGWSGGVVGVKGGVPGVGGRIGGCG